MCALSGVVPNTRLLVQSQKMWFIKIAMSGRRSMAKPLLSAFPTLRRFVMALTMSHVASDRQHLLLTATRCDLWWCVQAELGDIVYVELPEVGSEVKQGEQFGVVESVKVLAACMSQQSVLSLPPVISLLT